MSSRQKQLLERMVRDELQKQLIKEAETSSNDVYRGNIKVSRDLESEMITIIDTKNKSKISFSVKKRRDIVQMINML